MMQSIEGKIAIIIQGRTKNLRITLPLDDDAIDCIYEFLKKMKVKVSIEERR